MVQHRQHQHAGWLILAVAAIAVALLILLVPHTGAGHAEMLAIVPLLLVGMISPLSLLAPLANIYASRMPQAPVLASRFQRPPPPRRA